MNGWKIGLLALYGVELLLVISRIGKPRKPITPGEAVVTVIITGLLAFAVVMA